MKKSTVPGNTEEGLGESESVEAKPMATVGLKSDFRISNPPIKCPEKWNELGALSVPFALLIGVAALLGFGTIGVFHRHRILVSHQLRIDRCTAETSMTLKAMIEKVEHSNQRLVILRTAFLAAPDPGAKAALKALIQTEGVIHEALFLSWKSFQTRWVLQRGCGGNDRGQDKGDIPWPLPGLPFIQNPPDLLGARPSARSPKTERITVRLSHPPRHAETHLHSLSAEGTWKLSWSSTP